jgi:hypothetical protein
LVEPATSEDLARAIDRAGFARQVAAAAQRVASPRSGFPHATYIQGLGDGATKGSIDWDQVKRDVSPALLLDAARRLYRFDPDVWQIGSSDTGAPRLIHEGRQYNVADFLTKYLGRPWAEARQVLLDCYQATLSEAGPEPNAVLWRQFSKWRDRQLHASTAARDDLVTGFRLRALRAREAYRAEKANARHLPPSQRAVRVARARAERFVAEQHLAQERGAAYQALRRPPRQAHYRQFLGELAQRGDVAALAELRRMAALIPEPEPGLTGGRSRAVFPLPNYTVDARGSVTYASSDGNIVKDGVRGVAVLRATAGAYDAAIRIAAARYGRDITLSGDDTFLLQMVHAARRSGLELRIHDAARPHAVPLQLAGRAQARQK